MPICSPPLRHALAGLAACAACQTVAAAEWSIAPTVSWSSDHDSNRRLAVTGEEADEGAWLTLDAIMKRTTDSGDITLQPHLQLQRFSGDSALDSNDGSLVLSTSHHSERTLVSASAQVSRASTLTTELTDTGIIDTNTRQELRAGTLTVSRGLSERQKLEMDASYADVQFPNGLRFGLVGYRYPSASLTYSLSISPRTTLSASAFGSQSTAPLVDYQSRDAGVRFGVAYSFSERTQATASAGLSRADVNSSQSTGSVYAIRVIRNDERNQWNVSYDHSVQPSGAGTFVLRDTGIISAAHSIASTLSLTAAITSVRNAELGSQIAYDRRYFGGDLGISWKASPQWIWSFTAGGREARVPGPNETARGWRTSLHLSWSPLPWSVSR
jgi:hypothetical protein